MFGYVITNCKTLSDAQRARFRSLYCGMCRALRLRYGQTGRLTLSYDMTFVALVLSALYEPEEEAGREICIPHPIRAHDYAVSAAVEYAADLNILLAYHKCADNWRDDHNPAFAAAKAALGRAYRRAKALHPEKSAAIEAWMAGIRQIEAAGEVEIDPPMNLTGRMMGELFRYRNDYWADALCRMGEGLGKFIYFMDAYDDLKSDVRRRRFNPLKGMMNQPDFEEICRAGLTMVMADCADAFEELPVVRDADLIRNILYSGVWARYGYIQSKKEKRKGAR